MMNLKRAFTEVHFYTEVNTILLGIKTPIKLVFMRVAQFFCLPIVEHFKVNSMFGNVKLIKGN